MVVSRSLHRSQLILNSAASSVTGQVAIQLAKWSGLQVVAVADEQKHGARLRKLGTGKFHNDMACGATTD